MPSKKQKESGLFSEYSLQRPSPPRKQNSQNYFARSLPFLAVLLLLASGPDGSYPSEYFRSPLGIPIELAGSFAEMRSNHFHSGLDIKTNGKTGYHVYSAAEGWISRISVAPAGFGNALYVTHPNGFVTVYGHLERFKDDVAEYVKTRQYERESFSVNLFPSKKRFPVSKGDIIAFSGNAGSSSGPHLHFEVRDERTGWPENPLLFGFKVPDTQAPRIIRTKLYAIDADSQIRIHDTRTGGWRTIRGGDSVVLDMKRVNEVYSFSRVDAVEAYGRIGMGIQTFDYSDGSRNRLGTYSISLFANDAQIFSSKMERFSFDKTRFINAHVDYAEYVSKRRWIQRSFILPGNTLPFYKAINNGLLEVKSTDAYHMRYELEDTDNNSRKFEFDIKGISVEQPTPPMTSSGDAKIIHFDEPFEYSADGFRISVPSGTLYENEEFKYKTHMTEIMGVYSPVIRLESRFTPVQNRFLLAIDGSDIPVRLRDKAIIAMVDSKNRLSSDGGSFTNGYVEAHVRAFGDFVIAVDSLAPRIRPLNISAGKNLRRQSSIRLQISDDLSGIARYRGEIDGKWVLFSFDAKYALLKHTFDGSLGRGKHALRVELTDNVGNVAVYEVPFVR